MDRLAGFDSMFFPKSIAVIGASMRNAGGGFLVTMQTFGYKGDLCPVNPDEPEVFGFKTYPKVTDIPGPVDLALITTPAAVVPRLIQECLDKKVKAVEIFSAGFREKSKEGQKLEEEIAAIAAKGVRVIGPNCFGIHCPAGKVTILPGEDMSNEEGPVAFISQSGGMTIKVLRRGQGMGIKFSKAVSYGNACDVNESDLLEYLWHDPETKIIACYIEEVKDGSRFFKLLQEVSKAKPVIVWKAGLTRAGSRAASSHTGSLSGTVELWQTVFRQTCAVRVDSLERLLDTVLAFVHLAPHRGRSAGIIGGGGGISVASADACEKEGITVPAFTAGLQKKLAAIVPPVGASVRNPVDVGHSYPTSDIFSAVLEAIIKEGGVDAVIINGVEMTVSNDRMKAVEFVYSNDFEKNIKIPVLIKEKLGKPVIMVLPVEAIGADTTEFEGVRRKISDYYLKNGIPVFLSMETAARALSDVTGYYERLNHQNII